LGDPGNEKFLGSENERKKRSWCLARFPQKHGRD